MHTILTILGGSLVNIALTLYAGIDVYLAQKELGLDSRSQKKGVGLLITIAFSLLLGSISTYLLYKIAAVAIYNAIMLTASYYLVAIVMIYYVAEHLSTFNPKSDSAREPALQLSAKLWFKLAIAISALFICSYEISELLASLSVHASPANCK